MSPTILAPIFPFAFSPPAPTAVEGDTPARPVLDYPVSMPTWRNLARRAVQELVAERGEAEVALGVIVRRMEVLADLAIPTTRHSAIGAALGGLGLRRRLTTSRRGGYHRLVMLYTLKAL